MFDFLAKMAGISPPVSTTISLLALIVSGFSMKTARKSYQLSKAQEERRLKPLEIYMVDSLSQSVSEDRDAYLFMLEITNPSDSAISLRTAEMQVDFTSAGLPCVLRVPASSSLSPLRSTPDSALPLAQPLRLDANSAVRGWVVFFVSTHTVEWTSASRYAIILSDNRGNENRVDAILIRRELSDLDDAGGDARGFK